MNVKKILAICIVVLALISCLNIASAGWFDSNDNAKAEAQKTTVKLGNITDSSYTVDESFVQQAGNKLTINREDGSASPAAGSKVDANITYSVSIDISSLNDTAKKALKDEFGSGTHSVDFKVDNKTYTVTGATFSIDGNTLTIKGSSQMLNVMSGQYKSGSTITGCEFSGNTTEYETG